MWTWLKDSSSAHKIIEPMLRALVFFQIFTWWGHFSGPEISGLTRFGLDLVNPSAWNAGGMGGAQDYVFGFAASLIILLILEYLQLKVRKKPRTEFRLRIKLSFYAALLASLASLALAGAASPYSGSTENTVISYLFTLLTGVFAHFTVPIILVVTVLVGAAVLDRGLALGLLLITHASFLTGFTYDLVGEPPFFFNNVESSALAVGLFGTLATLPLLIYFQRLVRTHRNTASDGASRFLIARLSVIAPIIIAAFLASYISAWGVHGSTARQFAASQHWLDLAPNSALGTEIELNFHPSEMHPENPELAVFLVNKSAIRGQDIYIFKPRRPEKMVYPEFELVIAARGQSGRSGSDVKIIKDFQEISRGEERAILDSLTPRADIATSGLVPVIDAGAPTAMPLFRQSFEETRQGVYDKRVAWVRPPSPIRISSSGRPAYRPTRGPGQLGRMGIEQIKETPYILLALPRSINDKWWQPQETSTLGSMYEIAPWLFYGSLLFAGLFLFGIAKRDELRHELIQSEERARISQESHDRVSNRLSAIALQIELEAKKQAESQKLLAQLPDSIRRAVSDLKDVVSIGSEGPVSESGPLKDRLIEICELRDKDYSFALEHHIEIDDDLSLDGRRREALISCLEEALGNAAKHAKAKEVTVTIDCPKPDMCRLVVKDDGSGFAVPSDFDQLLAEGHMGLAGLAKRAKELGGELKIDSSPGQGATVEIVFGV